MIDSSYLNDIALLGRYMCRKKITVIFNPARTQCENIHDNALGEFRVRNA